MTLVESNCSIAEFTKKSKSPLFATIFYNYNYRFYLMSSSYFDFGVNKLNFFAKPFVDLNASVKSV
jgi:hypothetical protein